MSIEIVHGDCEAVLSERFVGLGDQGEQPSLIFTDPPYNLGIDYGSGAKSDKRSRDEYFRWCCNWIGWCVDSLHDCGSMWVMMSEDYADEIGCILTREGLTRRAWVVWYERFGVHLGNRFGRCSRHLLYYVKHPKHYTFNAGAVLVQSARQRAGDKRANPNGKVMDNVWDIPRVAGSHAERIDGVPTQIPLEIMRRIVGSTSNPGDLVVDPFCGSGTTGVACFELGRRFIGIDNNATYCAIARDRLRTTQETTNDNNKTKNRHATKTD